MPHAVPPAIERVARDVFGFSELRAGQQEAVEAIVAGRDTLAVMSTGYGKSAIYQIAALLIPGPTVVISPLIALQRDQIEELERQGAGGAAGVNSTVPESERAEALSRIAGDDLEFLFLSPEQLSNDQVLQDLAAARPSLIVVDEAHCISEWGHDFRPDYLRLGAVADILGRPPILALTATAAPPVREEIVARLGMEEPLVLVRGFNRPNIWLGVETFRRERDKKEALLERVAEAAKPGIVYVATRKGAEQVASDLREAGLVAVAYHAGLRANERVEAQEAFMNDGLDVIVATTAFGMGVDKANVRFVYHWEISESVDSLYQELGRSGRDRLPAESRLFYRTEDLGIRRFFAGGGQVDGDQIRVVAAVVDRADGPVDPVELAEAANLSQTKLITAVSRLEDVGAVKVLPSGEIAESEGHGGMARAAEAAASLQIQREEFDRSRTQMMQAYAEHHGCRRHFLLSYFGEDFDPPCGACDNCDAGAVGADNSHEPFAIGARVSHDKWGGGLVQRYEDDSVVVLFDSVGYKTLGLALVVERGLLEPEVLTDAGAGEAAA
jgi:ATP-dependent DNA helicase RecQ